MRVDGALQVKQLVFYAIVAVSLVAFLVAIAWSIRSPSFESIVAALALAADTLGLWYSRSYWAPSGTHTRVTQQVGNVVGGDLAGGNISKRNDRA